MADKDFIVKNSLVVNSTFHANSTKIAIGDIDTATANSIAISPTTISVGNSTVNLTINSTSFWTAPTTFNINYGFKVGSNVVVNTSTVFVGNSTVNAFLTPTGLKINGAPFTSGGGYYKGNKGVVGDVGNSNSLFRINTTTIANSITIAASENSQVTGPIAIAEGYTLTIESGGRVAII
jgi:hypothetical protein